MSNICHHIRSNGQRCGSPALRDKPLCYYHQHVLDREKIDPGNVDDYLRHMALSPESASHPLAAEYFGVGPNPPLLLRFPHLDDRSSIQLAISDVLSAVALNRINHKRASILLYGLQVASANLKHMPTDLPDTVVDVNEINTLRPSPTE